MRNYFDELFPKETAEALRKERAANEKLFQATAQLAQEQRDRERERVRNQRRIQLLENLLRTNGISVPDAT